MTTASSSPSTTKSTPWDDVQVSFNVTPVGSVLTASETREGTFSRINEGLPPGWRCIDLSPIATVRPDSALDWRLTFRVIGALEIGEAAAVRAYLNQLFKDTTHVNDSPQSPG